MTLIVLLIVSLFFPVLSGLLLVSLCWPTLRINRSLFWVKFWLSMGVGFGIASLNLALSTLLTGSVTRAFILGELLILMVLVAIRRYVSKPEIQGFEPQPKEVARKNPLSIVSIPFFVLLVLQETVFILLSLRTPHGYGDAVAFWNTRARLLFRAGTHWKEVFNLLGGLYADYPLLLPETVVRFWSYAGRETIIAGPLTAFLFTFGTLGLLVASLSLLRGSTQGLIGGLFLLSTPFFISHGASQYADVPFGFYLLAAIALLNISDQFAGANRGMLALSGLMAGLAAWTKNEGLLFLVGLRVGWIVIELWTARRVRLNRALLAVVEGALPVLVVTFCFKAILATKNDLLDAQGAHSLRRLAELSRYLVTFKAFLKQTLQLNSIPLAVLPLYGLFLNAESAQLRRQGLTVSVFALLVMFTGYFLVFVTTPYDLTWHLETSLNRLLLQLWPSTLFVVLMVVRSPQRRVPDDTVVRHVSYQNAAL